MKDGFTDLLLYFNPTMQKSAAGKVATPALLAAMVRAADKISDLIFSPGRPPQVQVYGRLIPVQVPGMSVLSADDTRHIAADLIGDNKQAITTLREHGACDISYAIPGLARFRANIFIQRGSCAVVLRAIPTAIPDFATLRLPEQLTDVTKLRQYCMPDRLIDSAEPDLKVVSAA